MFSQYVKGQTIERSEDIFLTEDKALPRTYLDIVQQMFYSTHLFAHFSKDFLFPS